MLSRLALCSLKSEYKYDTENETYTIHTCNSQADSSSVA